MTLQRTNTRFPMIKREVLKEKSRMTRHELSNEYHEYLKSEDWKQKSELRKQIDGGCVMCGSTTDLQVHHLNYKAYPYNTVNVYRDLLCLCGKHHRMVHNMMHRQTSPDGRHGWLDELWVPLPVEED